RRFVIVGLDDTGLTTDFSNLGDFFGASSITFNGSAPSCPGGLPAGNATYTDSSGSHSTWANGPVTFASTNWFACAKLPITVGTQSFKVPIDFGDGAPAAGGYGLDNNLVAVVLIDKDNLISGSPGGVTFSYILPHWGDFNPQLPSIFALLSDPGVLVDGIDVVLQQRQDVLNGQVFGVKLPFLGDLLKDNPVANVIGSFRANFLTPLANFIRENNLDLDGLTTAITHIVASAFFSLGLLEKADGT